jgi:hypothetical protein
MQRIEMGLTSLGRAALEPNAALGTNPFARSFKAKYAGATFVLTAGLLHSAFRVALSGYKNLSEYLRDLY